MSSAEQPGDRLHAVQRLQEIELDQAQVERTRLQKAAEEQRRKLTDVEAHLQECRTLEVSLMTGAAGVPVESLRQIRAYLRVQAQELVQQQEILSKAEAAADDAVRSVVGNFQRLSATRRLRERRQAEASVQLLRARYKKLDDMAIVTKRNAQ